MAGSVPEMVRAVVARTGLPKVFVEQRARALQDAGLLPVGVGRRVEAARPRDLARLLLALSADRVRQAPATVQRLGELATVDSHISDSVPLAMFLEGLVETLWGGNRATRRAVITIDKTESRVSVTSPDASVSFHPAGTIIGFDGVDRVRRTFEVPGMVIAAIGADLGLKGCADAA